MKQKERLIIAAILATAVMQMGTNGISPILANLAEEFPEASASTIQFLMTFPCLFVIACGLIAGNVAQRVPKKWLILTGTGLFILSGVLAFFFHGSLTILFVWSALLGIGMGIAVPVNMSQIIDLLSTERQATVMGVAASFANLGSMLMILAGGYLALIHWHFTYLVYLIAVPAFLLSLLALPNQVSSAGPAAEGKSSGGMLSLLCSPRVLAVLAVGFTSTLLFNTTPSNLSMRIVEQGLGNSAQAGIGSSLMLASGTISCMFYGKLSKRLSHYVLTLGFGLMFLGQLTCALATSIWMIYLGCLIAGASHGNNMAHCLMLAARYAKGRSSLGTSMVTAIGNAGAFATPFLTMLAALMTGDTLTEPRFLLSSCCAAAVALSVAIAFTCRRRRA